MFAKFTAVNAANARRLSVAGVVATALFGLAACGTQIAAQNTAVSVPVAAKAAPTKTAAKPPTQTPTQAAAPISYTAGMALISDGTATVRIGGRAVTFPTTVTGAAWSPDGSKIAFIDANGEVATARPDGTDLAELTTAKTGVTRANPSWFGTVVLFTETDAKGVSRIESVATGATTPSGAASYSAAEQPITTGTSANGGTPGSDAGNSHADGVPSTPSAPIGATGSIVYQHQGSDGPEVWILDQGMRGVYGFEALPGTDPAISPDGKDIAFVGTKGQIEIAATDFGNATPTAVQVSFGATDPTNLVWSPDGTRIAYSTPTDVESVAAKVSAHATSNPAAQLSATPGTATFLPYYENQVDLFTDTDPVALSVAASQDRWPTQQTRNMTSYMNAPAYTATIGSATALGDDLKYLSPATDMGPVLLTSGSTLDPRVIAELHRVLGTTPDGSAAPVVYILGGTNDVSPAVETALNGLGYRTSRLTDDSPVAYTPDLFSQPAFRAVAVDADSPLDTLMGTVFAGYYDAPVVKVSSTGGLSSPQLDWFGAAAGPALPTALFAPSSSVFTTVGSALAAQEGGELGYTTPVDPQNPVPLGS